MLDGATLDPGDNSFERLAAYGELTVHARTARTDVVARARDAAVVLTNKTVLDADAFAALPGLRLVCVLATGFNVVDVEAARKHGVTVCNVPAYSAASVAQHVFALILERTNGVAAHDRAVKAGLWARQPDFAMPVQPLVELAGHAIGVVGLGRIGEAVARVASALGMKVLVHGPRPRSVDGLPGIEWIAAEELFERSSVVSLHCPLLPETRHLVDAGMLARMPSGSGLVNTARGDLVDEAALLRALDLGRPAWAALDVLSQEPPPERHPLAEHPRCTVTPHVAWATLAARRRLMDITVANVAAFAAGEPCNVVVEGRPKGSAS